MDFLLGRCHFRENCSRFHIPAIVFNTLFRDERAHIEHAMECYRRDMEAHLAAMPPGPPPPPAAVAQASPAVPSHRPSVVCVGRSLSAFTWHCADLPTPLLCCRSHTVVWRHRHRHRQRQLAPSVTSTWWTRPRWCRRGLVMSVVPWPFRQKRGLQHRRHRRRPHPLPLRHRPVLHRRRHRRKPRACFSPLSFLSLASNS